jgi:3-oxo-5-alpha-steroid 4-dehydrogenase 1
MTETTFFMIVLLSYFVAAGVVFISLFFIKAPYGRYFRHNWGLSISNNLAWMIMESPSMLLFAFLFVIGNLPNSPVLIIFFLMWEAHYIHRAFIYPFTTSSGHKKMPVVVMLMAITFNLGNAYINGRYLFSLSGGYPLRWLWDPRFIIGFLVFIAGFVINRWADQKLRALRQPGDTTYHVPQGGLYRWISCPNYFGEIVEWVGWAIATWSVPGAIFAFWTFANLAPRAFSHHTWYQKEFPDYPKERKALIPGIW